MDEIGKWYAKKDADAARLRKLIFEKELQVAELNGEIIKLRKQLEMAEYVGD